VRTHTNSITQAIGKIEVYGYMEGRTEEDPGILFASVTALGTVTIDNNTVAPSYTVNSIGSNFGSMIKIAAKGTRTSSNAANSIKAEISVDLSVKSA
jgi:hypothetical protein